MREEDVELFRQAMAGVEPLKAKARVQAPPPRKRYRKPAPVMPELPEVAGDEEGCWDRVGERVFWQRSSLRPQEVTRLKKGQFPKHWTIDLHGMTRDEAAVAMRQFLHQAWQLGARHALVIHGKGYNSEEGPVLKQLVHQLLPTLPFVLAFASAQPKDGDTGATYVFMKAQTQGSP